MDNTQSQSQLFASLDDRINEFIEAIASTMLSRPEIEVRAKELGAIYEEGYKVDYRHTYSQFWPLILAISKKASDETVTHESVVCVSENLKEIRDYIVDKYIVYKEAPARATSKSATSNPNGKKKAPTTKANTFQTDDEATDYVRKAVRKLYDHISLEIIRYSSFNQLILQEREIVQLRTEVSVLNASLKDTTKELNEATQKAGSLQNDVISVLGIFSAIALAVTGGLTFTTSSISSLHKIESPYRLYMTLIIVGFVLCNLIFGLMYCIGKLTGKTVLSPCKCNTEKNGNCDPKKGCSVLKKVRKRLPFCFFVNVVFAIIAVIILVAWIFDAATWVDVFNNFSSCSGNVTSASDVYISSTDVHIN